VLSVDARYTTLVPGTFFLISRELNGPNIIARPLDVDDYMDIGYILPANVKVNEMTGHYIEELRTCLKQD
jgi:hypothetical protein